MESVRILGTRIDAVTKEGMKLEIARMLKGSRLHRVAKLNAEYLMRAVGDPEFAAYLETTGLNVADGAGVQWAACFLTKKTTSLPAVRVAQVLGQALWTLAALVLRPRYCCFPLPERIPGVEALYAMLEVAAENDLSVFFFGSRPEVNQRAREVIAARVPGLRIAGGCDGYREDHAAVVRQIDESGAELLVVALGSPKQDYWIRDHGHLLANVRVAVGEGGSLDFVAGNFRRAPRWMRDKGLEWLWRLFMNPDRTGQKSRPQRVWNSVPRFVCRVVAWKLKYGPVSLGDGGTRRRTVGEATGPERAAG